MAPEIPVIDDQRTRLCSECGIEPRRPGQRTGLKCHAAYMKKWRAGHVSVPRGLLPVEQRTARGRKASRRLEATR